MRKFLVLLLGIILLAGATLCFAQVYPLAFYPHYWITGTVNNATDGTRAVGRTVYFFKTLNEYSGGVYAMGTVGSDHRYMLNVFGLGMHSLDVGGTYYVAVANSNPSNPSEGYGADPEPLDPISGDGVDEAPVLVLAQGAGPLPPPDPGSEPAPEIKIWFGDRRYYPHIHGHPDDDKEQFVVKETGTLKIEVSIIEPFSLNEGYSNTMFIGTETHDLSQAAGFSTSSGVGTLVIESSFPETLTVVGGEDTYYTFEFQASSSGTVGMTATSVSTQAVVAVLGGPLRIVDTPIPFPAPYSPTKDPQLEIQYTLSQDGDIQIYIVSVAGETVKRIRCPSGTEGGRAGLNKVLWYGKYETGEVAGNGVYVGTIISTEQNKVIGKVKITVFD